MCSARVAQYKSNNGNVAVTKKTLSADALFLLWFFPGSRDYLKFHMVSHSHLRKYANSTSSDFTRLEGKKQSITDLPCVALYFLHIQAVSISRELDAGWVSQAEREENMRRLV